MSYSLSLKLYPKQSLKQTQRLIMSPQMQQAIHFLQLPLQELELLVEEELQRNPLLEVEDPQATQLELEEQEFPEEEVATGSESEEQLIFENEDFRVLKLLDEEFRDHFAESGNFQPCTQSNQDQVRNFLENSIQKESSLFGFLMKQAEETLDSDEDKRIAEYLIGNFDTCGYLTTPLSEISRMNGIEEEYLEQILIKIQTFEPYGIGARSIQESLSIQLRNMGKENSLAFRIIHEHYDAFLHHQLKSLQRKLKCTAKDLSVAMYKDIGKLRLHPGKSHGSEYVPIIVPDISIVSDEEQLRIIIHDENVPPLKLNKRYLKLLDQENLSKETSDFIKHKVNAAKWLIRNLYQRNETLYRIAETLIKHQKKFLLEPNGNLDPLNMRAMAEELQLHESTVARAVANKYIETPRGLLPLRFFFTHAYVTDEGEDVSSRTVKEEIRRCIMGENKEHPISDDQISLELKKKGITCARRTIAKYRLQLGFGNTHQRRRYNSENTL